MNKQEAILELAKRKTRTNLWSFCLYLEYDFFTSRQEQLKPVADVLEKTFKNGGKVAISMPPRTGKSTIINYFIAWVFLQDKNNAIVRASYSQTLSSELNEGARQIIESDKYKSLLLEPLEISQNRENKLRFKGTHRASLYATSVGGSSTGFGGNIIISDDIYKDHLEALSDTINRKTINWYHSAFASRLDGKKQCEIIIGTRWRVGELVDILEEEKYFDDVIKIKALIPNSNGDLVSFNESIITTDRLLNIQTLMHPSIFNSMYQQQAMESMEALIKPKDINYYEPSEYQASGYFYRIMVTDLADRGTDRTASVILDLYPDKVVVVDMLTDINPLEEIKPRLLQMAQAHKPTDFYIEDNHNSYFARTIAMEVEKAFTGLGLKITSETYHTTQNKRQKIILNAGFIKEWYFPKTNDSECNLFMRNLCKYDLAIKEQHDDEIDICASAINIIIKLMGV